MFYSAKDPRKYVSCAELPMKMRLKNKFRQDIERTQSNVGFGSETDRHIPTFLAPPLIHQNSEIVANKRSHCEKDGCISRKKPLLFIDNDATVSLVNLSNLSGLKKPPEVKATPHQSTSENLENSLLDSRRSKNVPFTSNNTFEHKSSSTISDCLQVSSKNMVTKTKDPKAPILTFPQKLMKILDNDEITDIISWLPCGKVFVIRNRIKFTNEIMPRYFDQVKYTSFTRKLHRWGFRRHGIIEVAYSHPNFRKDELTLCTTMRMVRKATKDRVDIQLVNDDSGKAQASCDLKVEGPFTSKNSCLPPKYNHQRVERSPQLSPQISSEILVQEQKAKNFRAATNISRNTLFSKDGTETSNILRYTHPPSARIEDQSVHDIQSTMQFYGDIISSYPSSIVNEAVQALTRREEELTLKLCQVQGLQDEVMANIGQFLTHHQCNEFDCKTLNVPTLRKNHEFFHECSLNNNLPFFDEGFSHVTRPDRLVRRPPAA